MEVEVNDRKSDKNHEWEKYLYPFPKTVKMVYYNKVVKDICETCHRLKPQTYIREQQSFRWNTKVKLHELNKAVNFYQNDASEIPKYKKITESKTCNNVCISLLTIKVEKTVTEGEALNALLTQRRERLLDESASRIKKGSEEVDNLNGFKGELQTECYHSSKTLKMTCDIHNCGFQGLKIMIRANNCGGKYPKQMT